MRRFSLLFVLAVAISFLAQRADAQSATSREPYCEDKNPRVLTVVLYPYIPNFTDAAFAIKQAFEARCPGLRLQIITGGLLDDYYSTTPHSDGSPPANIFNTPADVYEVDSVFFDDFVKANKVQAIPSLTTAAAGAIVPMAQSIRLFGAIPQSSRRLRSMRNSALLSTRRSLSRYRI